MKILTLSYQLVSEKDREWFAQSLSHIIEAGGQSSFQPYKPNENDDYFWTLDAGNDWKVKFFEEDYKSFGIIYRYEDRNNREGILAEWLKVRFGATEKINL